jgi:hypothetical protein
MKTNRSARWIAKIRISFLCLAIMTVAGIECQVGHSLASRFGQVSAGQDAYGQLPAANISDLFAAAR